MNQLNTTIIPNNMMNQMNPMMMNQMNPWMENNINQAIINNNNYNLLDKNINNKIKNKNNQIKINLNQKELINTIIEFFQNNGNEYMNFSYPIQIQYLLNQLDLDFDGFYLSEQVEDPLPYIKEEKKLIIFKNSNFFSLKVKIPVSINKLELYSIADIYKAFNNTNTLLI